MQNQINIRFGVSELEKLAARIQRKHYSSLFVLVDTNTDTHCLNRFLEYCPVAPSAILKMSAGEEFKNLNTCQDLWEELSAHGADRNSVLINLGGGVVTDLGGFVACTFKRGIAFYNIPTTLLAMVDASVGGKTGIDLGALKNQIGIIREPEEVIIDAVWLETLPYEELRSGFAEMLKHGLIANPSYWKALKNIRELSPKTLEQYIIPSVAEKEKVVLEDPNERGRRKILNFGHTLGHAIESYFLTAPTKKRLLHGEAIAIGMVLEAYLSTQCCGLSIEKAKEIKTVFESYFPKVALNQEDQLAIRALLRHDKKNKGKRINFVLLEDLGVPTLDIEVPQPLFEQAFEFYLKN